MQKVDRERLDSIALMKFIATLAIWNHLATPFYGKYGWLATGGAVGCSIFFYCSGFTLALGRIERFDVWYKRRLARLWPTCMAASLLYGLVGQNFRATVLYALSGAGWFVSCILVYYAVYWALRRYFGNTWKHFCVALVAISVWWFYLIVTKNQSATIPFGGGSFQYAFYYLFFILGAIESSNRRLARAQNFWLSISQTLIVLVAFYGVSRLALKFNRPILQTLSLFPLAIFVRSLYASCRHYIKTNMVVAVVGGLSLEMYLVGAYGASSAPLGFGPLSYLMGFVLALVTAYLVRSSGRFLAQTLSLHEGYDWIAIFRLA